MEYKAGGAAVVLGDGGAGGFEIGGYASTFNNVDQGNDRVMRGAFKQSLKERPTVPLLWAHDPNEPIGKVLWAIEDDTGLLFKARLSDTRRSRDIAALARDGAIGGMSIGYNATGKRYVTEGGQAIRELTAVDLLEVSAVVFPMNERATFAPVESGKALGVDVLRDRLTIADFEQKSAAGAWQPPKAHLDYLDAMKREWEREDNGGQTDREAAYDRAYQMQEAMRKLGV